MFGTGSSGSATWDTRAVVNGPHTLTASVKDARGNIATTAIVVTVANGTAPAAPSGLTDTAVSSTRIDLAWNDASDNETGFEIERFPDAVTYVRIATVGANVTSYADASVGGAGTYSYRVRAFNAAGSSPYSNTATATVSMTSPAKPTDLVARAAPGPRVELLWKDRSTNESASRCCARRTGERTSREIATVGPNVTTFTDTAVAPNTTYSYRIRAFDSAGTSGPSNTATTKTTSQ